MLSKTQIIAGVGLLLTGATVLSYSLKQRWPARIPLVPPQRFRAWWFIVAGLLLTHQFGRNPVWGNVPNILSFGLLSCLAMRQFMAHLRTPISRRTRMVCYLACVAQYYWVYIEWYGFFVVFIPVFMFLYLPASGSFTKDTAAPMSEVACLHWALMMAVFCLSHAAFLLTFIGGQGLLFFVVLLTEVADAVRLLLARTPRGQSWSPVLSSLTAIAVAWVVAPAFTPLHEEHIVLAGLVLGVAGSIGHANTQAFRSELNIEYGGALERIESLAYTAPIFFHGYRYFDYPM